MRAWRAVLGHPFFARTAGEAASVSPGSRPASTRLRYGTSEFGRKEISATVRAGQTTELSFRY